MRERWSRLTGQFDLDHFVPQVQAPERRAVYANLVYACHACNLRKRDESLPLALLTSEHVRIYEDGRLVGLTAEGRRFIRVLYLNTPQTIEWRRMWIRTIHLAKDRDP
ncbi:MAG: hypothetical protein KDA59_25810, partial [Planctomycetales bacterium]|nr:hypothetical protein [Planctomycetales bacterium]